MTYAVYFLRTIDTQEIFYVGVTGFYLYYRLSRHRSDAFRGVCQNIEKNNYILNHPVEIVWLQTCRTEEKAFERELHFIMKFQKQGLPLTNRNTNGTNKFYKKKSLTK